MSKGDGYFEDADESGFGRCLVLTGPWRDELAALMSSQRFSVLRLSHGAGWRGSDISFVSGLPFLVGLEVYSPKVKDISPVLHLTGLRLLGIQCDYRAGTDFSPLSNLEVFKLFWRPKTLGLESFAKLRHLNVVGYPGQDLIGMASLKAMRRLQISSTKTSSLGGVESMAGLEEFDAALCTQLTDISALVHCEALESVEFQSCRKLSALPADFHPSRLRYATFIDCGKIQSLLPLASCSNLKTLKFTGDTSIVDGNLDFLSMLPALEEVSFANRAHYTLTREELAGHLRKKELQ